MSRPCESPLVAILVPLYAHSVLVADALLSALEQVTRYPFVIIVVNDGCRHAESDLQVKSILAVHADKIRYLVQRNSGLSAARNTGIDYAVSRFQSLQAIYFLDADNAIRPTAIESAYAQLLRHPQASWVYPNIDMFGIRRHFDYGGPYSPLKHTRYNICEAGSLVHRRVFDAGVRFDEKMRLGYEDWDFWLTAAERGFTGVHNPHFGFLYRNRAESMLSQSKRDDGEIAAYMRSKHRTLLGRRNLARLQSREAPRFALVFTDTGATLLTDGARAASDAVPQATFDALFWRNVVIPNWQHIPPVFIFTSSAVYHELRQSGLASWLLYECERTLEKMNFVGVAVEHIDGFTYAVNAGGTMRDCSVLAIGRELLCTILRDVDTRWVERIQGPEEGMKVAIRTLTVPHPPVPSAIAGGVAFAFLLRVMSWRSSPYLAAARRSWIWRDISVPPPHALAEVVRQGFAGEVVFPEVPATGRHIGFVVSIGSFGGVERVAYNVAREFSRAGWQIHLFLLGGNRLELPEEFATLAASINFLEHESFGAWDASAEYHGTALPAVGRGDSRAVNQIVAALGWLDAVVNCHSGALNAAVASLRTLGVKTVTHLHLLDHSALGRSGGHAMIALAYEHAYDLTVCNSAQLLSWMHAAGVPSDKLLLVPNAPGHSLDEATRARMLARRRQPHPPQQLNALFLGRLDRQKGIDRLTSVVEHTQRLGMPVNWRIVGAAVTGGEETPAALAKFREPAVFERDALTALLGWADVLLLLSDYEGVALSVLEAQRAGVIVIATHVGALAEVIDSGRTGFLVELDTAVEETMDILELLLRAPGVRAAIAAQATRVIEWPEATAGLIARVTFLVDAKRRQAPQPVASPGMAAPAVGAPAP